MVIAGDQTEMARHAPSHNGVKKRIAQRVVLSIVPQRRDGVAIPIPQGHRTVSFAPIDILGSEDEFIHSAAIDRDLLPGIVG